jgi:hypothetical protein
MLRFNEGGDCLYLSSEVDLDSLKEGLPGEKAGSIRRRRQTSHKPLLEDSNYLALNREDLAF